MNANPQFEPMFPAHSIERCSIIITFDPVLPPKAFQKAMDDATRSLRNAGLETAAQQIAGIQFDVATGRFGPATGPRPAIFSSPDKGTNYILTQNALTVQTGKYVRWQPLIGQFEELIMPLVKSYADIVSITSVQLDYLDRFFWTGDWSNFDWRHLLKPNSKYLAEQVTAARLQWHSHSGRIDLIDNGTLKRLINVNIDATDAIRPRGALAPAIGVFTLMQDRTDHPGGLQGDIQPDGIHNCLDRLHGELKTILGDIISDQMAARIGMA